MIEPELPLALTQEQKRSVLWGLICEHMNKKLELHRRQLEGDKDEKATSALRGRIAELRSLLSLSDDPRKID